MRPLAILILAAGLWAADPAPGTQPQIPRQSPELAIQLPGKVIQISQYKGYICVLAFMSTTCPHCQHLATVMAALQPEYAQKGVQMLGVTLNAEANTDLPNFTRVFAHNSFPIGMSVEPIARKYLEHPPGLPYFPMIAFLDKKGVIRAEHLGATDPTFFDERTEVQNIRGELDKIIAQPVVQLPAAKKK
ncbi:MAG TPA: TlpA disulfide reductase family protein [Bryobacteraceae bacterium]|jgi:thiol-disulfide isomerase/thioredoxin